MKRFLVLISFCIMCSIPLSAQSFDDISEFSPQGVGYDMSNARSAAAFLDWSKFQMHHSVSMSMGSSSVGAQSYLTYQNQFFMPINSKLSFYGNLYWQLQTYASNPALERLNAPVGDIYFDANLVYKISENSTLSLGFAKYPSMNGYSYLPGMSYNPYSAYDPFFTSFNGGMIP